MPPLHPKTYLLAAHALGALAVVAALVGYHTLLHSALVRQEQTHNRSSEQLKQGLRDSLEVRREHLKLTRELKRLKETVEAVHGRLPVFSTESRFLARATTAAEAQRIELKSYRRDKMSVGNGYGEVCVELNGTGSHASICRFLQTMKDFPHTVVLTRLEINSSNSVGRYTFAINYRLYHNAAAGNARTADAPAPVFKN